MEDLRVDLGMAIEEVSYCINEEIAMALSIKQKYTVLNKKQFVSYLIDNIYPATEIEDKMCDIAKDFASKNLNADKVFALRKEDEMSYCIEEALRDIGCELDSCSYEAMDAIYEEAGVKYLIDVAYENIRELEYLYLMKDVSLALKKLIDNSYFESDKYRDNYSIEDFVLEIDRLSNILIEGGSIENIEDKTKNLIKEYFDC